MHDNTDTTGLNEYPLADWERELLEGKPLTEEERQARLAQEEESHRKHQVWLQGFHKRIDDRFEQLHQAGAFQDKSERQKVVTAIDAMKANDNFPTSHLDRLATLLHDNFSWLNSGSDEHMDKADKRAAKSDPFSRQNLEKRSAASAPKRTRVIDTEPFRTEWKKYLKYSANFENELIAMACYEKGFTIEEASKMGFTK
jgi:hypothetical protein